MAETRDRGSPHQLQVHSQSQPRYDKGVFYPHKGKSQGPTAGQILAIVTLLPVGGSLLGLAGIVLVGTLISLAIATPLFIIFSPVLVPAVILLAGAVTGILASGAFGLTGLSSLSWVVNMFRQATGGLDYAKGRMQQMAREAGEAVGDKAKQFGDPDERQKRHWDK